MSYVRWSAQGWQGWCAADAAVDVDACLAADAAGGGRRSRHARSQAVATAHGRVFVKSYPPPGAARARQAFSMGRALETAGFAAPRALLVGARDGAGLLVTADAGGDDLLAHVTRLAASGAGHRHAKRALLRRLGAEVARLHRAGFVHGISCRRTCGGGEVSSSSWTTTGPVARPFPPSPGARGATWSSSAASSSRV